MQKKLKITFLGTGTSQGIPVIGCECKVCKSNNVKDKRLRSSILISFNNKNYVIDAGPDFRQQMLSENVKSLEAIILTHEHKDHIAGLDDVRAFNFIQKKAIDVYASDRVLNALKREYHYVFSGDDYPGIPKINLHSINNKPFKINDLEFIPIEVLHYKLPVFGFRIANFTYITDAKYISKKEKEKIKGSKILVLNALRIKEHLSHFTLEEAINMANDIDVKKTFFTHISHLLGKHNEIQKILPENMFLAYDGLKLEIAY